LAVHRLSFRYGKTPTLDSLSFDVCSGVVTILLGLNGSGKTTLFSLLTRLFAPDSGRIEILGMDLHQTGSSALRHVGIVFQQTTLDLDLSVAQNLLYFAALQGMGRKEAVLRMTEELEALDLADRLDHKVRTLNGGHRRRLEIARALMHQPSLLLLDEPTVGLDIDARKSLVAQLHDLVRRNDIALLWATHLIDEVREDDTLLILDKGRLLAAGAAGELVKQSGKADLVEAFAYYRTAKA